MEFFAIWITLGVLGSFITKAKHLRRRDIVIDKANAFFSRKELYVLDLIRVCLGGFGLGLSLSSVVFRTNCSDVDFIKSSKDVRVRLDNLYALIRRR